MRDQCRGKTWLQTLTHTGALLKARSPSVTASSPPAQLVALDLRKLKKVLLWGRADKLSALR